MLLKATRVFGLLFLAALLVSWNVSILHASTVPEEEAYKLSDTLFYSIHPALSGSISGLPERNTKEGTHLTLTAVPSEGYVFDHWVIEGADGGNQTQISCEFTLPNHPVRVQAHFRSNQRAFTFVIIPSEGGEIDGLPDMFVDEGTPIHLTAVPSPGYAFWHWVVEGADGGSQTEITSEFVMPMHAVNVQAHFRSIMQGLSYVLYPSNGGSIAGMPKSPVAEGTPIQLTAVPRRGFAFDHWVVVGADGGSQTTLTTQFSMPMNDVRVQAHFAYVGENRVRQYWFPFAGNVLMHHYMGKSAWYSRYH